MNNNFDNKAFIVAAYCGNEVKEIPVTERAGITAAEVVESAKKWLADASESDFGGGFGEVVDNGVRVVDDFGNEKYYTNFKIIRKIGIIYDEEGFHQQIEIPLEFDAATEEVAANKTEDKISVSGLLAESKGYKQGLFVSEDGEKLVDEKYIQHAFRNSLKQDLREFIETGLLPFDGGYLKITKKEVESG